MSKRYSLGQFGGLKITADETAALGGLVLAGLYSVVGYKLYRLRPGRAIAGGLVATLLHFLSELWHQFGHARAARESGYPMEGIHLWGVLGNSVYPVDEPDLSGDVHVRRALGGPKASLGATIIGTLIAALIGPTRGLLGMISTLFALENLLIFTLGAFLPLRFIETDGSILLRYRRAHRRRSVIIQE
ncbi:MAG: hypothetical protein R6X18_17470 [Chloroflexota bacterium]